MAEGEKETDWGLIFRRIVSVIVVVLVVPSLMRKCSHQEVYELITADSDRQTGNVDQAIARYTALIKQNPNWSSLYSGRGDSYRRKGDLDHAFADLDRAIELDPDHFEAHVNRCAAWRQKGDLDRAIADCEAAARVKPDDPEPTAMVGRMLLEHGDVEAARLRFDKAVSLQPNGYGVLDSRFYRGQIALFHQNRPADAAQDFGTVLTRAFDYVDTARMLGGSRTAMMAYQHPFEPDGFYLVMWQHIARVRAGQADAWELGDNVKKIITALKGNPLLNDPGRPDPSESEVLAEVLRPWPGRFIALYLGKLRPEAIRAAAEAVTDPATRRRRVCDVDFYLGVYALEKGSTDEARKLLQAAADGCPASAPEAGFAKSELKRIKS